MVMGAGAADDRCMTTGQPRAEHRLLRRTTDDRVIGGVAGGLGDYLNVDPLLIRIGFVGLMVFGGLGLILYLAGWIFIPEESEDESVAAQLFSGLTARRFLIGSLLVVGAFILVFGILPDVYRNDTEWTALLLAVVVIVVGGVLRGRNEQDLIAPAVPVPPGAAAAATPRSVSRPKAQRVPRPRSPLAGYAVGATLAAVGLLALAANLTSADVQLGQYFGLALGVIGLSLVVGAWWGHARVLILLGLVVLPFAIAASLITVPLQGGFGAHYLLPATADEVRPEYRLVGGQILLDLSQLETSRDALDVTASVAMGELVVYVPSDADLEIDAAIGGGDLFILDRWQSGTHVTDHQVVEGNGRDITLDLEAGVGNIRVETVDREPEEEVGP